MKLLNKWKGFTLMEVMIVVAIIGILAAIGIPSYRNYVIKAHRKEAIAQMMEIVGLLEKNYTANGEYQNVFVNGVPNGLNNDVNLNVSPGGATGGSIRYNILVALGPMPSGTGSRSYTITVTPNATNDQNKDKCRVLTINQLGVRTANGAVGSGCF